MVYKLLCVCLLMCYGIGCTTDSTNDGGVDSIFPTPPVEPQPSPPPSPLPPPVVPEPIVQPDPVEEQVVVPPAGDVRDLVAPKLIDSSIADGAVDIDVNLNSITLTFDENIAKSDVKIINEKNVSLRWKRIINGKNIILTPLQGAINLRLDQRYSIFGIVKDAVGNERAILVKFTTGVEDKVAPRFIGSTIGNGDIGVDSDTDHFIFTFDEDIGNVRIDIRKKGSGLDLQWTHLIRGKEVILHKFDKGLPLVNEEVYHINIAWADTSGNWNPGGFIEFTTEIKE